MPLYNQASSPTPQPILVNVSAYDLVTGNLYIIDTTSRCILTLPTNADLGSSINIINKGSGGWRIAQNSGQAIHGAADSTAGVSGYIESQTMSDTVFLRCTTQDTDFKINSQRGTLTIV